MKAQENEAKQSLTHRIHTRITKEKYDELTDLLNRSPNIQSHSELLRNILDHQQIRVENYDASQDKFMEELCNIRRELQSIGVNINQVTRSFHIESLPDGKLSQALEITKIFQETQLKVNQLLTFIAQNTESWSAK